MNRPNKNVFRIRDNREKGHYRIDTAFIKEGWAKILGVYGVAVYNVLAAYAGNDTQAAWPSYQLIANSLSCSRRQVIRAISKLEELNLIQKSLRFDEAGDPTSNYITLLHRELWVKPSDTQSPGVVTDSHQGSDTQSPGVVTDSHQGSDTQSPKLAPSALTPSELTPSEVNLNNNGASPTTSSTLSKFFPETDQERLLLGAYSANTGKEINCFPNALLQIRFKKAVTRLGPRLNEGLEAALTKPGISLKGVIDYLYKYVPPVDLGNDDMFPVSQVEAGGGVDALVSYLCKKYNLTPELLKLSKSGNNYRVEIVGLRAIQEKYGHFPSNGNEGKGTLVIPGKGDAYYRKGYNLDDDPNVQAFRKPIDEGLQRFAGITEEPGALNPQRRRI